MEGGDKNLPQLFIWVALLRFVPEFLKLIVFFSAKKVFLF